MKNSIKILALVLTSLFFSCESEEKSKEKSLRPVKYQEVNYSGGEKIRTFSGTSRTDKIINLSFRSTGIITQFDIKLGQKVKKGQLLAKLDNVQSRLNYENSISSKNSAESQMNTAKLNLNRVRTLYEKGSTSLSDFEAAKNSYRTAQQSFESAKRSVAIQQEQVNYGYLYAPEDGLISAVIAEVDENITPGQTIGTLNSGIDMEIALGIPESVINRIKQGMAVDVSFTSLNENKFDGKVTEVSPAVDASTATYPIRITLNNTTDKIKSGMAANVTFNFSEDQEKGTNALIVPAQAVGEDSDGHFVFLLEEKSGNIIAKKQRITIGDLTFEGFEIISGITIGQKIAIAGLQTLLDGQEVKLN